jgi:transcription termination/antitermination factor nusG
MAQAEWYVAHTYSGYENKVKADIEKTIINRGLEDQILEVCVPLQSVVEVKNGSEKVTDKKLFPGYVLVHMVMNDETWYVVRNTRGVTGFVGPGSKPVALTIDEIYNLGLGEGFSLSETKEKKVVLDFAVGDLVLVTKGPWEGTKSNITAVNEHKKSVSLNVEMFGRETKVEIGFSDIKKC